MPQDRVNEPIAIESPSKFDIWLNQKGFEPHHPLIRHFRKFAELGEGVDLDIIYAACWMLAVVNVARQQSIEVRRKLRDRKRRWTRESRALFGSYPGGQLRLTEVAQLYTMAVAKWTVELLVTKGLVDRSTTIEANDFAGIKQQALEPFANMHGFPDDWDAAIDGTGPVGSNLLQAVGFTNITPEHGEWIKSLISKFWPEVFQNKRTKRSDYAGTIFLLWVTQHLRKATGKPHFGLAFNLMTALQVNRAKKTERKTAETRVREFKKQLSGFEAMFIEFEQAVRRAKTN